MTGKAYLNPRHPSSQLDKLLLYLVLEFVGVGSSVIAHVIIREGVGTLCSAPAYKPTPCTPSLVVSCLDRQEALHSPLASA